MKQKNDLSQKEKLMEEIWILFSLRCFVWKKNQLILCLVNASRIYIYKIPSTYI